MNNNELLGALTRGMLAGAVGTIAMTLSERLENDTCEESARDSRSVPRLPGGGAARPLILSERSPAASFHQCRPQRATIATPYVFHLVRDEVPTRELAPARRSSSSQVADRLSRRERATHAMQPARRPKPQVSAPSRRDRVAASARLTHAGDRCIRCCGCRVRGR